jgi:hypothetical protein
MRRRVAVAAAVLVAAIASAGFAIARDGGPKPVVVRAGNMVLRINGDITPKVLPRNKLVPMDFWGSGKLTTLDGSHPPALEEASFDTDKDVVISVEGLPPCRIEQLEARATKQAKAACEDAVIGRGSATVEVAFPEQKPFTSTGPLLLFNGGERNGAIEIFAHAYVDVPAPTAVVSTVEITRTAKGSYGTHIEVAIPKIAGGAGSFVAGRFAARRIYTYRGERRSVVSGRCSDGRIQGRGTFRFSDGTSLTGTLVRACTARD